MNLVSERLSLDDYDAAVELFYARGWTDGLPVVLPTRPRVEALIRHVGRDPQESLGPVPPLGGEATVEKLAINAVMGGCRPEDFPVVLAAMEALLDPAHNLNGVSQTTHMCVPLVIVHGPVARALGVNARDGVFGNGYRANAAIGRAVRLALWNLGGARPGETDKATLSHPAEYAFCIAEAEDASPWPPFHAERGFAPEQDAVTVFACEGPHSVFCWGTPGEMLHVLADSLTPLGSNNVHVLGQLLVVLNPWQAREFARHGYGKAELRVALWERARRRRREILACGRIHEQFRQMEREAGRYPARYDVDDPDLAVPVTARPEDIHLVVAGGESYFAGVLPGWGGFGGFAVTRPVRRPGR